MEPHLSQYKIFYEVAKAGNISKAAKELYISQPAISKTISRLEESLETSLFTRNPRGVSLTAEGQLLFDHISQAFQSISLGEQQLKRIKDFRMGKIRIGVSTTLCKYVLLPRLQEFIQSNPHVIVNIAAQSTSQTESMVEKGLLDLGLVAMTGVKNNMIFEKLMDIQDTFITTPKYLNDFYLREGSSSDVLSNGNLILLDQSNITRQYIDSYFSPHRIAPNQILEVSTMDLLIEFVKIGLGVGCAIREFVEKELREGTLIEIKTPFTIETRCIGYCFTKNNNNPILEDFLRKH